MEPSTGILANRGHQVESARPVSPAVTPPPGSPRFPGLDGLRGIAILMVVACHATAVLGLTTGSWGWIGLYLYAGVVVFFALSGFLIYRPFVVAHARGDDRPALARFARRRLLRIVPAYWLALTVLSLWPGTAGDVLSTQGWTFYLFLQVYSTETFTQGIPIAWSLCVEVTFYALVPLYAWSVWRGARATRRPWWQAELVAVGAFAVAGVVGFGLVLHGTVPPWGANTLLGTTPWFAGGMLLAILSVAAERPGRARRAQAWIVRHAGRLWLAAGVSFVVGARIVWATDAVMPGGIEDAFPPVGYAAAFLDRGLLGLAAVLLLAPVVADARGTVRAVSRWRPLALLGVISYGVFLWHYPLLEWLSDRGPALVSAGPGIDGLVPLTLVGMATSVIVATVSYRLVERPLLRRKEPRGAATRTVPERRTANG